jgi:hypothetical protein
MPLASLCKQFAQSLKINLCNFQVHSSVPVAERGREEDAPSQAGRQLALRDAGRLDARVRRKRVRHGHGRKELCLWTRERNHRGVEQADHGKDYDAKLGRSGMTRRLHQMYSVAQKSNSRPSILYESKVIALHSHS